MKASQKRQAKEETKLNNKYSLTLTKQEMIFIFNFLVNSENKWRLGDGYIGFGIVKKIEPFVVPASSTTTHEDEMKKEADIKLTDDN